jgi:hypothetical protein
MAQLEVKIAKLSLFPFEFTLAGKKFYTKARTIYEEINVK